MNNIKTLLEHLALYGGKIVCTAALTVEEINQARASNRMYVDDNSIGYVWIPDVNKFPETPEEVELFEQWFPLTPELPLHLRIPFFITNGKTSNQ